jgi:hypothetical protein
MAHGQRTTWINEQTAMQTIPLAFLALTPHCRRPAPLCPPCVCRLLPRLPSMSVALRSSFITAETGARG